MPDWRIKHFSCESLLSARTILETDMQVTMWGQRQSDNRGQTPTWIRAGDCLFGKDGSDFCKEAPHKAKQTVRKHCYRTNTNIHTHTHTHSHTHEMADCVASEKGGEGWWLVKKTDNGVNMRKKWGKIWVRGDIKLSDGKDKKEER